MESLYSTRQRYNKCVEHCRDTSWQQLLTDIETIQTVCQVSSGNNSSKRKQILDAMRCCVAHRCMVEDPTFPDLNSYDQWLISKCRSRGFKILDGPNTPNDDYICDNSLPTYQASALASAKAQGSLTSTGTSTNTNININTRTTISGPTTLITTVIYEPQYSTTKSSIISTTFDIDAKTMSIEASQSPTVSSIVDPSLPANLAGARNAADAAASAAAASNQSKVAIAVTISVVSVIVILTIMILLYQRSKSKPQEEIDNLIQRGTMSPPGAFITPIGSPRSVYSPAISFSSRNGASLTPPPRLRERRFLMSSALSPEPRKGKTRMTRNGFHVPLNTSSTRRSGISDGSLTGFNSTNLIRTEGSFEHEYPLAANPPFRSSKISEDGFDESWSTIMGQSGVPPEEIGIAREFPPPPEATETVLDLCRQDSPTRGEFNDDGDIAVATERLESPPRSNKGKEPEIVVESSKDAK